MFIVKFDFKEGKLKPDKCKTEVEKWARKNTFPNLQLPDGFLKKIIEVIYKTLTGLNYNYRIVAGYPKWYFFLFLHSFFFCLSFQANIQFVHA